MTSFFHTDDDDFFIIIAALLSWKHEVKANSHFSFLELAAAHLDVAGSTGYEYSSVCVFKDFCQWLTGTFMVWGRSWSIMYSSSFNKHFSPLNAIGISLFLNWCFIKSCETYHAEHIYFSPLITICKNPENKFILQTHNLTDKYRKFQPWNLVDLF